MGTSYPDRTNATGLWKLSDIYRNINEEGTYPQQAGNSRGLTQLSASGNDDKSVDAITIPTAGNATDFGDVAQGGRMASGLGSATRSFFAGGRTPSLLNRIDYIESSATGNFSDFGDLTVARRLAGACGNRIQGHLGGANPGGVDSIEKITYATIGNAVDFGDLVAGIESHGSTQANSPTRGLFAGGGDSPNNAKIEFLTFSSSGGTTDFGDLTNTRSQTGNVSSTTRAVFAGGTGASSVIDAVQIGSLGNAVDFGDLTAVVQHPAAVCNLTRGVFNINQSSSVAIDFITIPSAGNGSDFGDATASGTQSTGSSNAHGGIDEFIPRAPELYSPTGKVLPRGLGVGDIGLFQGGEYGYTSVIDYIQISSTGNGVKFGDLIGQISVMGGTGNSTRFFAGGGQPSFVTQIQYGAFSTKGNTADYGDLTAGRDLLSALGNETRGVWGGGRINPSNDGSNVIDYITMSTLGNATDFGDLTVTRGNIGGNVNSSTRGIFHGGDSGSDSNVMDYITIGSTGNATDFGDLTRARKNPGGFSSTVRGVMGGGFQPGTDPGTSTDIIDYVTIASTGNATDFGDLAFNTAYADGVSNNTRGVFAGLNNPSAPGADGTFGNAPQILYVTIASTGNTTLFGELTSRRYGTAPASNGHGGLS